MLRITSGLFKGRAISQPNTSLTRPVSEQTRHAIFQVLGDIEDLKVADLFAGSGALGLEALSLGADRVVFVDSSEAAVSVIKTNIISCKVTRQAQVVKSTVVQFLDSYTEKFDLILFDPPYAKFDLKVLEQTANILKPGKIIVVSCSVKTQLPVQIGPLYSVKNTTYGDTQIAYYRLENIDK